MQTKRCNSCEKDKDVRCFHRRGEKYLQHKCKDCVRQYAIDNKERLAANRKAYGLANSERRKSYLKDNAEHIAKRSKAYKKKNADRIKEKTREYRRVNRELVLASKLAWHNSKYRVDPMYTMTLRLRNLIRVSLKSGGYGKNSKTASLLGADYYTVYNHLVSTAIRTYGVYNPKADYHIDHIIPCASAETEDELMKLQHYRNLQLLTPEDNISKGAKLSWRLSV